MFVFRLALALGRTVRELLFSLDSHELAEWMAYDRLEPFGPRRTDFAAAIVAATVANAHRSRETDPFQPADFMPVFGRPNEDPGQSWEEQLDVVRMLNAAFGGDEVEK